MICKKCGAETLDKAVFCGNCGTRVDGKKPCLACNQLNDENSVYCVFCGARIDGKKVCLSCGTAYESKFCPACGYGGETVKEETTTIALFDKKESKAKDWSLNRILSLTASCLGILGVLFALIFTFFIGVDVEALGQKITTKKSTIGVAHNLFYFFGGFFKDVKELNLLANNFLHSKMYFTLCTYGILGIVITLVTITFVLTFAAIAISRFIMNVLGRSCETADKWSVLTIGAFFFGTGAFYGLHKFIVDVTASADISSANSIMSRIPAGIIKLNGDATVGIIICAILLGLFAVCKIVAKGKALLKAKAMVKLMIGVVGVALSAVVFVCVKNAGVAFGLSAEDAGIGVVLEIKSGFTSVLYNIFLSYVSLDSNTISKGITSQVNTAVTFGNLAQILFSFALIFVVLSLCYKLFLATEDKAKPGLVWDIVIFVALLTALIFALISISAMKNVIALDLGEETINALGMEFKPTGIIVALVFAVLNLVLSITQVALNHMEKPKETKQNYNYYY